jgi:putative transposase
VSYGDQSAQLKEIRAADPGGQGRHSFTAQQQTLRRLNTVFAAYFRRVGDLKKVRRVGYPRFKPHQRFDQVMFVAGDGAKWEVANVGRWAHASFQAVGRVKVHQHRPVVGRVKTLQLKREGRCWYVVVVTDIEPVPLPATGRAVGIDVGVARFLTTSDGEIMANPRFLDATQRAARRPAAPQGTGPAPAPATEGGCGGRSPRSGARSAASGATSTTSPPGRWSTPATPSPSNSSGWPL